MELNWYKLLFFTLMCFGLASSQNITSGKLRIVNVTASSNKLGSNISLKCEVQGNPSPDVWWTKDGSYVHGFYIQFEDGNRTLYFGWTNIGDIGTYYCHARNNLSYVNASFALKLINLPVTRLFPPGIWLNHAVQLYTWENNFRIICYTNGYPNPRVTWKRHGIEILHATNSSVNTSVYQQIHKDFRYALSELYFKEVYCHDARNYTCETSIEGYDYVRIQYVELICPSNFSKSILSTPSSTTAVHTSVMPTLSFTPPIISNWSRAVITPTMSSNWLIATLHFTQTPIINQMSVITPTPTSSLYSLRTSSVSVVSATTKPPPAYLYVTPVDPKVVANSYVVLTCNCGCSIQPQWFKNNQSIRFVGPGTPYNLLANGSLHISVSRQTAGNYSCEVRTFSWLMRSKQVKLEVWYLPVPRLYARGIGPNHAVQLYTWEKNFRIVCYTSAYPNPRITWKRHGIEILDSTNSSVNTRVYQQRIGYGRSDLYFKEVYCHDAGNYTCESSIEGYDYVRIQYVELICYSNFSESILSTLLPSTAVAKSESVLKIQSIRTMPTLSFTLPIISNYNWTWAVITPTMPSNRLLNSSVPFTRPISKWITSVITPTVSRILYSLPASSVSAIPVMPTLSFTLPIISNWSWAVMTPTSRLFDSTLPPARPISKWSAYVITPTPSRILVNATLRFTRPIWSTSVIAPTPSPTTWFTTKPPPVYLYVTPVDPKIVENSSVVLSCNCGCSIPPQWLKNNQSIRFVGPGSPYTLLGNGSLHISVSRQTAGNYSCEVRTFSWRMRSKQVNLEVWYLDDFYVNGDQEIYRGQNISLTCHGNGNPQPIFTWYLHEQQLKTNSRITIQENQLDIFNATINDGGEYICAAYNQVGNVSHAVLVRVEDIPPISIMAYSPKYTLVGSAIQFKCYEVRKAIQKLELVKDGISSYLWLVRRSFGRYTTGWYNATKNDTGKYQCKGSIGAASRYSSPFYLVIGIPSGPVVLEKEPETSITGIKLSWKPISKEFWNGEQITFGVNVFSVSNYVLQKSYTTKTTSAIISGLLPATKYIVNVTGKTVFGPVQNLTVAVKTKENFDKCEIADSNSCHEYAHCENVVGTYICTCFEDFFGDGKECQGPPQITSKSPANITEFVETNVTLVCTVIAYPNPTTVWKRIDLDGKTKEIKRTSDKFDGNYTIYNARLEDSGKYICNGSNTLGYESYATEITIKPVIVNIDVEINLSNKTFEEELKNKSSPAYKKLEQDVHDELYNFFNNTSGFEGIEILGFVNGSVRVLFRVIIKVLKPSKERKDVVAVSVGRKIFKQLKTGRIGKFAVKPGALKLNANPPPPANVTFSDVRETRVHIYWDPPELHELFSIERYYISYLKHASTEWSNKTIDSIGLNNFQLDNLESDTFYILKITAANACCLGQDSKRMEIKTLKVKVVSPWYYIGPIIAVACVILLVIIICLVRRVSVSGAWRLVEDRKQNWDEKEPKTSFQMTERRKQNEDTFTNMAYSGPLAKSAREEIPRTSIELSKEAQ